MANLSTDRPISFDPYEINHDLGGFILIDKITNATIAAGMLHFSLRRSQNVHWQALDVTRETHANLKNQKAAVPHGSFILKPNALLDCLVKFHSTNRTKHNR